MSKILEELDRWLASKTFYDSMQVYRHSPPGDQKEVLQAYDEVKGLIRCKFIELFDMDKDLLAFQTMVERNQILLRALYDKQYKGGVPLVPARCPNYRTQMEHLAWMLEECIHFFEQGKIVKAHRWVGYVQGCMAKDGVTSEELEAANRS